MPTEPVIQIDRAATRRRVQRLQRYVEGNLLSEGEFRCHHWQSCRASIRDGDIFREGTMSHVGRCFDLTRNDKPLRVVIVGQEAKDSRVTLEDRYRQTYDETGLQHRYYADKEHKARNPHMRGTTSALRVLFGRHLGEDYDGEWVRPENGRKFHIFDGFALVNRLLCYAGPEEGSQARATPTMLSHCGDHFVATLSILEPTIVVLQGQKAASGIDDILKAGKKYSDVVHEAFLNDHRMIVCALSHPAAHEPQRWGDRLDAPYLTGVVEPALKEALRRS